MVEIMLWLPAKSLIRFKCVCKSWHALISALIFNPTFVAKRLYNVKEITRTSSLAFCYRHPTEKFSLLTISGYDHDLNDHIRCATEVLNLPTDLPEVVWSLCHCDGIICITLTSWKDKFVLFNPAIKESQILPQPSGNFWLMGMGFGYDCRASDYKIVRLGFKYTPYEPLPDFNERSAEVYSMRTDSWREIEMRIQIEGSINRNKVFCKGVFYCRLSDMIFSFNMCDEAFRRIPLPDNLQELGLEQNTELAVWNDSLAFFFYPSESHDPVFIQVWMINKSFGGVEGACFWVKYP